MLIDIPLTESLLLGFFRDDVVVVVVVAHIGRRGGDGATRMFLARSESTCKIPTNQMSFSARTVLGRGIRMACNVSRDGSFMKLMCC